MWKGLYSCICSEMLEMKQKRKQVDYHWVSNFSIPIHSTLGVHSPTFSHVEMVHSPLLSDKAKSSLWSF